MKNYPVALTVLLVLLITNSCNDTSVPSSLNCDRVCLESYADKYLDAVINHDPTKISLSQSVKFTENGQRLAIGDGLWNTANARGSYNLYVADPQTGQIGLFGTIRENDEPALLALRLKIENDLITEIETIVARDTSAALLLEKLGKPHPVYLQDIPEEERLSREDLIKVSNMYFTGLEKNDGKGIYPFTDDCNRIENGQQTTNNPMDNPETGFDFRGLGAREQFESGFFRFVTRIRDRRFMLVDEERGLVFAFVFFDHAGNVQNFELTNGQTVSINVIRPWTWEIAEIFKIEKGLIRQIEVVSIEAPYGMNSGWSEWEDGLSSRIQ